MSASSGWSAVLASSASRGSSASAALAAVVALLAMSRAAYAQEAVPGTSDPAAPAPSDLAAPAPSDPANAITPPAEEFAPPAIVGPTAPADMGDQGIGAAIGAAIGGRTTPGGLRVAGNYLYQLTAQDWFDGTAAFTFGSGDAECFRDRMDSVLCDHGVADGYAVELSANVRRFMGGRDKFWPFARAGMGVALVRFADDDVTGVAIPLHFGVGLRVSVSDGIAVTGQAELDVGVARFTNGPGVEPQLGVNVSAGAEFRL